MTLELNSLLEMSVVKACLEQYIECCQNCNRELEEDEKEFFEVAKNIWLEICQAMDEEDED